MHNNTHMKHTRTQTNGMIIPNEKGTPRFEQATRAASFPRAREEMRRFVARQRRLTVAFWRDGLARLLHGRRPDAGAAAAEADAAARPNRTGTGL